jgi:hypothetical protein
MHSIIPIKLVSKEAVSRYYVQQYAYGNTLIPVLAVKILQGITEANMKGCSTSKTQNALASSQCKILQLHKAAQYSATGEAAMVANQAIQLN